MGDEQAVIAEQYFVEQAGIVIEHLGMPRMAGLGLAGC